VDKVYYKNRVDLEEKVKCIEGDVPIMHQPTDKFTFQVRNSQSFLSHSMYNGWVVESGCTHRMAKDDSLFTSLNVVEDRKIYVANVFSLDISIYGNVSS